MPKFKRPEYKYVNHLWETRYLGRDQAPGYENAVSPKVGGYRAAEKALYMKKMSELFKKVRAEHPLVKTSLEHRDGRLFLLLEERRPGDFEIEKRFLQMGEKLRKLEQAEAKRLEKKAMEYAEREYDRELEEKEFKRKSH